MPKETTKTTFNSPFQSFTIDRYITTQINYNGTPFCEHIGVIIVIPKVSHQNCDTDFRQIQMSGARKDISTIQIGIMNERDSANLCFANTNIFIHSRFQ